MKLIWRIRINSFESTIHWFIEHSDEYLNPYLIMNIIINK